MRCKAALPKQGFATHSPEIDGLRCKATIRRRKSLISNDDFGRNEPIALQLANALQSPTFPALQRNVMNGPAPERPPNSWGVPADFAPLLAAVPGFIHAPPRVWMGHRSS